MTVRQIYEKYLVPLNLQKHMLRVAGLSQILMENWRGETLDKEAILYACLFHDMANIIKFDFTKPAIYEDEVPQREYLKKLQAETIQKYGIDLHNATLTICKEIGLSEKIIRLVGKIEWKNTLAVLKEQDFETAIIIYCDMRIGPHGILPYQERLKNLRDRNPKFDYAGTIDAAILLENKLQKNISVPVDSITNEQINGRFDVLSKREV